MTHQYKWVKTIILSQIENKVIVIVVISGVVEGTSGYTECTHLIILYLCKYP